MVAWVTCIYDIYSFFFLVWTKNNSKTLKVSFSFSDSIGLLCIDLTNKSCCHCHCCHCKLQQSPGFILPLKHTVHKSMATAVFPLRSDTLKITVTVSLCWWIMSCGSLENTSSGLLSCFCSRLSLSSAATEGESALDAEAAFYLHRCCTTILCHTKHLFNGSPALLGT